MKRLLKNNHGMTLMEILVALTLLMIVIVGTTPVMLSAFDGLYTAGEFTQDTYEAKSEVEDKLATRNTKDIYNPGFQVNFQNIGEVANINARRAVSSLKGSVEALFSNGKVHVAIVSAKEINDDYSEKEYSTVADSGWHELILQTTNLDFGTTDPVEAGRHLSVNSQDKVKKGVPDDDPEKKYIDVTLLLPKRDANGESNIYNYNNGDQYLVCNNDTKTNIKDIKVEPITGRITMKIRGFDFTQSPIKILCTYLDENDNVLTTYTYLKIKQPSMIAVGETGSSDYYTSPGVVVKSISKKDATTGKIIKTEETSFGVYGRDMTLKTFNNAEDTYEFYGAHPKITSGVYSIPSNTILKSINWITEDEATGIDPYYVLTGTNGTIYRTYSFNGANDTLKTTVGLKDENKLGKDYKEFFLKDRGATTAYPAFWGGDKSFQFGYSSYKHSMGYNVYGSDEDMCWYTGLKSQVNGSFENSRADVYSTKAKHAYYYNGHTTAYDYMTQNSRKISYILTETGNAMRRGGLMSKIKDFSEYYNKIWEQIMPNKTDGGDTISYWYEPDAGDTVNFAGPVYFTGGNFNYTGKWTTTSDNIDHVNQLEEGFSQLRIKYITTNSPYSMATQKRYKSENAFSSNMWLNDNMYTSDVTITDAIYLPKTTANGITTGGEMFYVGTVSANALINQTDSVFENSNQTDWEQQNTNDWRYAGYRTAYAVFGNAAEETTSVYKFMYTQNHHEQSADSYEWFFENATSPLYSKDKTAATYNPYISGNGVKSNEVTARNFYVYRYNPGGNRENIAAGINKCLFNDVQFTMGFASDRAVAYSQIVFGIVDGEKKEAYKGCEPYYFLSHWGDTTNTHNPTLYMTVANYRYFNEVKSEDNLKYFNSYDNDYYNVWFPGEMYNLTKVATKDGVTVSVGYAVAGSTYQFVDPREDSNTSTALGGIYNDGVLAAMIGGVDPSLANLLYYKDNDTFDDYSLTSGDLSYNYKDYNGNNYKRVDNSSNDKTDYNLYDTKDYGTHTRDSVQFTAVDIGVQRVVTNKTEKATYYAYYADNKGRVFRSKVAEKSSTIGSNYDPEKPNENVTVNSLEKVRYISDVLYVPPEGVTYQITPLPADDTIGYMEQLEPDYSVTFSALFKKITTVRTEGNLILVSGVPNDVANGEGVPVCIGMMDETTRKTTWTIAYLQPPEGKGSSTKYHVQDILVRDGYVYVAGVYNGSQGFMMATELISLSEKLKTFHDLTNPYSENRMQYPSVMTVKVPDPLYAIAGQ